MFKRAMMAAAALMLIAAPAMADDDQPGAAARLPTGACLQTRVKDVGPRLEGAPDSGVGIEYASGDFGSSYDAVPALRRVKAGDPVKLCVISTERHCPRDTTPSQLLAAQDLRSGAAWRLYTTEHSCRGQ